MNTCTRSAKKTAAEKRVPSESDSKIAYIANRIAARTTFSSTTSTPSRHRAGAQSRRLQRADDGGKNPIRDVVRHGEELPAFEARFDHRIGRRSDQVAEKTPRLAGMFPARQHPGLEQRRGDQGIHIRREEHGRPFEQRFQQEIGNRKLPGIAEQFLFVTVAERTGDARVQCRRRCDRALRAVVDCHAAQYPRDMQRSIFSRTSKNPVCAFREKR